MKDAFISIQRSVPATIFECDEIKERASIIFAATKQEFQERVDTIRNFISEIRDKQDFSDVFSYDSVFAVFEMYFYKNIADEAIKLVFECQEKYNVKENIIELLSEEKMIAAIMGKPIIDAFADIIRNIPHDTCFGFAANGSLILVLQKEFLGLPIFERK